MDFLAQVFHFKKTFRNTEDKAKNSSILHTQFLNCVNTSEAARKINYAIGPDTAYKSMLQRWLNPFPGDRSYDGRK